MNKNINTKNPVSTLENNEKVIEKYNDSNSHFIRILLTVPADGVVTFSSFTVFENYSYIYWGDGTRGRNYSHTYTVESGLRGKDVNIIIADTTKIAGNFFYTGAVGIIEGVKELYFGKGVIIDLQDPSNTPEKLKKLLNISNTTENMLAYVFNGSQLTEITLNPDCLILEEECFRNLGSTLKYLDCSNVLLFERNCFLHTIIETIVLGKNFIEPENWGGVQFQNCFYEGSEEDYNNNNYSFSGSSCTNFYYYSEEEPLTEGNYWHWVKGKPVIWE